MNELGWINLGVLTLNSFVLGAVVILIFRVMDLSKKARNDIQAIKNLNRAHGDLWIRVETLEKTKKGGEPLRKTGKHQYVVRRKERRRPSSA